jgi:hypothetical protein
VVEYTFLADFDLLRDTNRTIVDKPWSQPTAHNAMNTYFKIHGAKHEIVRLNVEIRRLRTFMVDEEHFLEVRARALFDTNPEIAFQIERLRQCRMLVNTHHRKYLDSLHQMEGFSGFVTPGKHKGPAGGIKDENQSRVVDNVSEDLPLHSEEAFNENEDGADHDDEDELDEDDMHNFISVLAITDDNGVVEVD